ncbi:MAG: hypothetical protein R2802_00960 [Flavobacteriaceae bacterium]|nr:hypothetical protein [Flavobacteriaceae bacterium]HPF96844.1 hypothetical protein [Mangrovimonas sp.]HRV54850.1 hypothetical protein [Mangrovimonas sp.]
MKNLLLKSFILTSILFISSCSSDNDNSSQNASNSGEMYLTIDGEEINFEGGITHSNFNIGNPPGFVLTASGDTDNYPVPYLEIFIKDVTDSDFVVGTEFIGEEELEMEYILYNESTNISPSVFSAYTEDDVYLKITEVNTEEKTISGIFTFTGLDTEQGWFPGGLTYEMEGSFENMSYD